MRWCAVAGLVAALGLLALPATADDPVVYTGCVAVSSGSLYNVHEGTSGGGSTPLMKMIGRLVIPHLQLSTEILTVGEGAEAPSSRAAGSGQASGRAVFDPIMVVKAIDLTSPELFYSLAKGEVVDSAEIDIYRADAQPDPRPGPVPQADLDWRYRLSDVMVTSMETITSGDAVTEKVGLTFSQICIDVFRERVGHVTHCWNQETQTGS